MGPSQSATSGKQPAAQRAEQEGRGKGEQPLAQPRLAHGAAVAVAKQKIGALQIKMHKPLLRRASE